MKAYMFNTENGIYEGETFEETDMLDKADGITTLPPPEYDHGKVPVFDYHKNEWVIIPATIARQLLSINTHDNTEKQI